MVEWREAMEGFYVLLVIISLVWAFASLYPSYGATSSAVLTVILGFFEVGFGYILFEKVLD